MESRKTSSTRRKCSQISDMEAPMRARQAKGRERDFGVLRGHGQHPQLTGLEDREQG